MALLDGQFLSGDWTTIVNGWRYPPSATGRYGGDFLLRAADQSLAGILTNDPAEAVYLVNFTDSDDRKLVGAVPELHFDADNKPPADSFWSLALYGTDAMTWSRTRPDRYSIGDRTDGLKTEVDGGLTIHLQAESPGSGKEANWLPCPSDGEWFLVLRIYRDPR